MERIDKILKHPTFCEVLKQLEQREVTREFCTHDMDHLLGVARIMQIQAMESGSEIPRDVLYGAALLHDIGKLEQYETGKKHAKVGAVMAVPILRECGYEEKEIEVICKAIKTHNNTKETGELGLLLRTSDKLSRNCFYCKVKEECNWSEEQKIKTIRI